MDFRTWLAQDRTLHRLLLIVLAIGVAAFRDSIWRDLLLYGGLLLLTLHLEFRHAVVAHLLQPLKRDRPREPDAQGATRPAPRTYN